MKTHCTYGHELTPENIKWKRHANGKDYGECKQCDRERAAIHTRAKRATRYDALPEGFLFPDTGCAESPSCLKCPLPVCVHDTTVITQSHTARNRLAYEGHKAGVSVPELARRLCMSERAVYRAIQRKGAFNGHSTVGLDDVPGKPVSEISNGIRARKPLPVMKENLR